MTIYRSRIYDDITQTIGGTPLIRLNRLQQHAKLSTAPLAKAEFFNPAGSIKDRPALAMLQALMVSDTFSASTEIIEASSGNNGVACAWLCAIYGIPLTVVIPEHMSIERQRLIRHYGAKVITTEKSLGTKGAIDEAKRRVAMTPNAVSLDQFSNAANPEAHAQTTANEIWHDTHGQIDVIIAGVGTGGTLTGIARSLLTRNPALEVVAVEPARCPVLSEGRSGVHNIQGLSSGHVPDILDTSLIHSIMTVGDEEAVEFARLAASKEGLAVGISSGATLAACCRLTQSNNYKGKNVVVILADGAERYFSTPLFD